jgi:uncharacterized protein (DUF58 family)
MLLEPETLQRLDRLCLSTHSRLAGLYPGEHRSRRLGSSVDFADWRPYVPGDDFRRIDFGIYARLDRLVVRLYEAEEELLVRVILDASASMGFEGKLAAAARLAGALAYVAGVRRDRARVWVIDGNGLRPSPWARSRQGAIALFDWLDQVRPAGSTNLAAGLNRLAASGGLPGLTVVLSDLMTEDWEGAVRKLAGPGAEAAVLHMLAPSELDPTIRGDLLLVDSESVAPLEVSMSEQVLSDYRHRAQQWVGQVSGACRQRDIRYALVHPGQDVDSMFGLELRKQGVVRG